jgi:chemotaxis protein methyltransferase CheR
LVRREGRGAKEAQAFINQLTTNKTSFFRERHHFEYLKEHLQTIVAARAARTGDRRVRLWSAASSTGEEAYSMAMIAAQATPPSAGWDVKILATDIDTEVLRIAGSGEYDVERIAEVPAALRARFFSAVGPNRVRVAPELARLLSFEQANLVGEPFRVRESFDVIFCRNVIIYFDQPTQKVVLNRLSQRLNDDGRMYLGHSETLLGYDLEHVAGQIGAYRRGGHPTPVHSSFAQQRVASASPKQPPPLPRAPAVPLASLRPPIVARRNPKLTSSRAATDLATPDGALPHRRIVLGEFEVATSPCVVSTLLGSCVSVCLFDAERGIGGMNHFMLPNATGSSADPAHFGVHAMELLINALMTRGARRKHLQAKAFGAGAVTRALPPTVGHANAAFARAFLQKEAIPLLVERLGGDRPRQVFFRTDTGEVLVRTISAQHASTVSQVELGAWQKPVTEKGSFDVDDALF